MRLLWIPLWCLIATVAVADDGKLCETAARQAAREADIPYEVLQTITHLETGRLQNGEFRPWPWAINHDGKGFWPSDRAIAIKYVTQATAGKSASIDIGCFQINTRWHGAEFASVSQMFDPHANARYAAGFLKLLKSELGSWDRAIAAYHSRTPALGQSYLRRFNQIAARLAGRPPEPVSVVTEAVQPKNSAGLLPASGAVTHAALNSLWVAN